MFKENVNYSSWRIISMAKPAVPVEAPIRRMIPLIPTPFLPEKAPVAPKVPRPFEPIKTPREPVPV